MDSTGQTTATSWLVRQPFLSVPSLSQLSVKRGKEVSPSEVLGELKQTIRVQMLYNGKEPSNRIRSDWDKQGHPE